MPLYRRHCDLAHTGRPYRGTTRTRVSRCCPRVTKGHMYALPEQPGAGAASLLSDTIYLYFVSAFHQQRARTAVDDGYYECALSASLLLAGVRLPFLLRFPDPVLSRSNLLIAPRPSPNDRSLSMAVRFSRQLRKAEAIEKTSERDIEDYSRQRDQIEVRTPSSQTQDQRAPKLPEKEPTYASSFQKKNLHTLPATKQKNTHTRSRPPTKQRTAAS